MLKIAKNTLTYREHDSKYQNIVEALIKIDKK